VRGGEHVDEQLPFAGRKRSTLGDRLAPGIVALVELRRAETSSRVRLPWAVALASPLLDAERSPLTVYA
jgi:hypothetical protein